MRERISRKRLALLEEITQVLGDVYPTLRIVAVKPKILVRGVFPVRLEQTTLDRFLIEIEFPNDYPVSVPSVRETGDRIPKELDRHVLSSGIFCLFLPDERWKYWSNGKGVRAFLEETVNDFLLSQVYFEHHGRFPFGERRHGVDGIYDYYAEELGTRDTKAIKKCIRYLGRKQVKGHWRCFCGSGKRLRHCHIGKMRELHEKVPPKTALQTQARLRLAARMAGEEEFKQQQKVSRSQQVRDLLAAILT